MDKIKSIMLEHGTEMNKIASEQVEVYGESIDACLKLAAEHFHKKIYEIDYTVLKRGKKKFLFPEPYHIRAFLVQYEENLEELRALDNKLTGGKGTLLNPELKELYVPKDKDGILSIKNYRSGIWVSVTAPVGNGKYVTYDDALRKFTSRGITPPDEDMLRRLVGEHSGETVRIGNSKIVPMMEGQIKVDISGDWMKGYVIITPPKTGGRDIEVSDVVYELKQQGIKYGIKEDEIKKVIDEDKYNYNFLAAMGDPPINGKNAEIVYHVRTERKIQLKEDTSGKVDFKNLDLIENVVAAQLLAEKFPAEKGKYGRNLMNEILEAKDGQDVPLSQGKGTILSSDGKKLTAEVNGQALFLEGKISVETVYKITGDVGSKTGNVTFLGSIVITGSIEDNFHVKASGNIEVYGTVQKAVLEADGDIVIRQGITGRDEARVESTGGSVIAKFIQHATVIAEKDVAVQEGVMHSEISAGGKITCNGKKGVIVGGFLRSGQSVSAKVIGSASTPATDIIVGVNPKILKQINDYTTKMKEAKKKAEQAEKSYKTVLARKESDPESFTPENEDYMNKLDAAIKKLMKRVEDCDKEIQTLISYMEDYNVEGKIYFEKVMHGGVTCRIKNSEPYKTRSEIKGGMMILENKFITLKPYEPPEGEEKRGGRRK